MTKEQLIDEHVVLFEQGANLLADYRDGKFTEKEYEILVSKILAEMYSLSEAIEFFDEPLTHE